VDALLCDIDDADGMARAIRRVKSDSALATRLVANGHARLASAYTKDGIVRQYLEVFARAPRWAAA
jgi:glycosyltransferase involved in cell wall biosynthesis